MSRDGRSLTWPHGRRTGVTCAAERAGARRQSARPCCFRSNCIERRSHCYLAEILTKARPIHVAGRLGLDGVICNRLHGCVLQECAGWQNTQLFLVLNDQLAFHDRSPAYITWASVRDAHSQVISKARLHQARVVRFSGCPVSAALHTLWVARLTVQHNSLRRVATCPRVSYGTIRIHRPPKCVGRTRIDAATGD